MVSAAVQNLFAVNVRRFEKNGRFFTGKVAIWWGDSGSLFDKPDRLHWATRETLPKPRMGNKKTLTAAAQ